jgi:mono/diheme cytochrome c family protein
VSVLVWLAALSAVFTATTGYILSNEDGYGTSTVTLHMRLGIGLAIGSVALAVVHLRASEGTRSGGLTAYRVLLGALVLLLFPTGHLGGTIAHGEDFLAGPTEERRESPRPERGSVLAAETTPGAASTTALASTPGAAGATDKISYARGVAPIFAARCAACHGDTKKKGGLSLKDPQSILAGGRNGPVIAPGKKDASEMIRRLRLPASEEDHMPPEAKTQPTEEEIATIEKWIAAGAEFDLAGAPAWTDAPKTASGNDAAPGNATAGTAAPGNAAAGNAAPGHAAASGSSAAPATVPGVAVADPAAIEALRAKLVHVEPLSRDSNLLIVSFAAVAPETDDAEVSTLLEPLRMQIADLSLARTKIGDETMKLAARMPNLSRLDVRETAATDAGVAALKGHAQLSELVLARTHLTDAAVDSLLALPALKKVFLWNSGVGVQGLAKLRQQRADLAIEAGLASDARPIEKEKDVVLTKPAPAAGPAINTVCPVTGKPVDPANQIVFKGRVIGFCCPKCPDAFRADPAKYESKLP